MIDPLGLRRMHETLARVEANQIALAERFENLHECDHTQITEIAKAIVRAEVTAKRTEAVAEATRGDLGKWVNRIQQIVGMLDRIEYGLSVLFDWLRARDRAGADDPLPRYATDLAEVQEYEAWKAERDGRMLGEAQRD